MNSSNGKLNDLSAEFPSTRWSLVGRASQGDSPTQPPAIAEIARMYMRPLRTHLMHLFNGDEHRADDILQGFLTDKVLEQRLISLADPTRGRFRSFLLTALDRYIVDEYRRAASQKRSPRGKMHDIDEQRDTLASGKRRSQSLESAGPFDLAWAREVLDEVLTGMRHHCEHTNRLDLWAVFEVRYLSPATNNVEPEPYESIARRLQLDSAKTAANLLVTARRVFTRSFTAVVSRYATSKQEVREEVEDLWRIFSTATR